MAALILLPGLSGPFLLDDYGNIVLAEHMNPEEWNRDTFRTAIFTNPSGPTGRPVAMATFALNVAIAGMDPKWMKLTNILIHALNVMLLWWLTRSLLDWPIIPEKTRRKRDSIASITALLWGIHPIAVTSTLYIVQRMNSLSAGFVLLSLLLYVEGRKQLSGTSGFTSAGKYWAGALLAFGLGALSKENAFLIPFYILLLELTVLQWQDHLTGCINVTWRRMFGVLSGVASGVFAWLAIDMWSSIIDGFGSRDFSLAERLLTEPRVLWTYVEMVLLPALGSTGLFLDDYVVSKGFITPVTTLPAILGLLAVALGCVLCRTRFPLLSYGIGFFLVGHSLESSFLPLEIAFEHRNYLPSSGLVLCLACVIHSIGGVRNLREGIAFPLVAAIAASIALETLPRASAWSSTSRLIDIELKRHPDSARANLMAATQIAEVLTDDIIKPDATTREDLLAEADRRFDAASRLSTSDPVALLTWRRFVAETGQQWSSERQNELLALLGKGRPEPYLPAIMTGMVECTWKGHCDIRPDELSRLIDVTLENKRYRGAMRAELLLAASQSAQYVENDSDGAIALMEQSIRTAPGDPRLRVRLAQLFIELGDHDSATKAIAEARRVDKAALYTNQLRELAKSLAATE